MSKIFKRPGVFIQEVNTTPNSIAQVETAIPVFIGYTEIANDNGNSLLNTAVRIRSVLGFEILFGKASLATFSLEEELNPTSTPANFDIKLSNKTYNIKEDKGRFNLYESIKFFFQNGGEDCYVISVGNYKDGIVVPAFSITPFLNGLEVLKSEDSPTILVIPDAVLLDANNCYSLQEQMVNHCGELKNRVAILDIHSGDQALNDIHSNPIINFRNQVSSQFLSYGASYYSWLNTTIVQESDVNFTALNMEARIKIKTICENYINANLDTNQINALLPLVKQLSVENLALNDIIITDKILKSTVPDYRVVVTGILKKKNILPPSAAIAGIYSSVDANRGVWKAPANVSLSSVTSTTVDIDDNLQQDLNAPIDGKSICAIRTFSGVGIKIWGARTLDGNNHEYRYISVRRTIIMLEQSIQKGIKQFVFEPNNSNTWVRVQFMIENYLTILWRDGALAGSKPEHAFVVLVGLGKTMTANDIEEGVIKIQVMVALVRPAEFIVISLKQQMQEA